MIPPVRQLPNKTLYGTPRSVLVEFGLYLIGVHELVVLLSRLREFAILVLRLVPALAAESSVAAVHLIAWLHRRGGYPAFTLASPTF